MTRREKLEALLVESPDDTFLRYALALTYASEGNAAKPASAWHVSLKATPTMCRPTCSLLNCTWNLSSPIRPGRCWREGLRRPGEGGDTHAEGSCAACSNSCRDNRHKQKKLVAPGTTLALGWHALSLFAKGVADAAAELVVIVGSCTMSHTSPTRQRGSTSMRPHATIRRESERQS